MFRLLTKMTYFIENLNVNSLHEFGTDLESTGRNKMVRSQEMLQFLVNDITQDK